MFYNRYALEKDTSLRDCQTNCGRACYISATFSTAYCRLLGNICSDGAGVCTPFCARQLGEGMHKNNNPPSPGGKGGIAGRPHLPGHSDEECRCAAFHLFPVLRLLGLYGVGRSGEYVLGVVQSVAVVDFGQ